MTAAWGNTTDRILLLLRDEGPMTRLEIEECLGVDKHTSSSIVSRLCRIVKRGECVGQRRIHIARWVRTLEGEKDYIRAVYAFGHGEHARKPKADPLAVKRRYWARRSTRLKNVTVFNLGAKVRVLMGKRAANDIKEAA